MHKEITKSDREDLGDDVLATFQKGQTRFEQFVEVFNRFRFNSFSEVHLFDPRLDVSLPLVAVLVRNVKNSCARDCGLRCEAQISDFEEQPHVRKQVNSVVVGQRQHFVVVHHRVHVFNPVCVEVSVQNDPLLASVRRSAHRFHDRRKNSVLEVSRLDVDVLSVKVVRQNGLRI